MVISIILEPNEMFKNIKGKNRRQVFFQSQILPHQIFSAQTPQFLVQNLHFNHRTHFRVRLVYLYSVTLIFNTQTHLRLFKSFENQILTQES